MRGRRAERSDWKVKPLPRKRKLLSYVKQFSDAQYKRLCLGLIPETMDDRWFVFSEGEWTQFHRSWTGSCIYKIRFEARRDEWQIAELWVNREPKQYGISDDGDDREVLDWLIDFVSDSHR